MDKFLFEAKQKVVKFSMAGHGFLAEKSNRDWIIFAFLSLFLVVQTVTYLYLQFFLMDNLFYHESAYPLLYAEEIKNQFGLFPVNFSGREVAPVGWPIVGSILLLLGFPVSIGTHSLMCFLFTLFFAGTVLFYAKKLGSDKNIIVISIIAALMITQLPPTKYAWLDQVYIWPMNSYGVYDAFSLLFFVFVVNYLQKSHPSRLWLGLSLAAAFLFGLNGIRGALMIVLPTVITLVLIHGSEFLKDGTKMLAKLAYSGGLFICTAAGYVFSKVLSADLPQPWQERHQFFSVPPFRDFQETIFKIPYNLMSNFGVARPGVEVDLVSFDTIITLTKIFVLGALLYFLVNGKGHKLEERLALWRSRIIALVILTAAIFSGTMAARYFIPLCLGLLLLLPVWLNQNVRSERRVLSLTLVSAILLVAGSGITGVWMMDKSTYESGNVKELTSQLREKGYTQGYVGPWKAHGLAINQFSSGKVRVGLIDQLKKLRGPSRLPYRPHPHADQDWYLPSWYDGSKQFIAFRDPSEFMHNRLLELSSDQWSFKDWTVYEFEEQVPFDNVDLALGDRAKNHQKQ